MTVKIDIKWDEVGPELLEACEALMEAEPMQDGKRDGGTMGSISIAIDKARKALAMVENDDNDHDCKMEPLGEHGCDHPSHEGVTI